MPAHSDLNCKRRRPRVRFPGRHSGGMLFGFGGREIAIRRALSLLLTVDAAAGSGARGAAADGVDCRYKRSLASRLSKTLRRHSVRVARAVDQPEAVADGGGAYNLGELSGAVGLGDFGSTTPETDV